MKATCRCFFAVLALFTAAAPAAAAYRKALAMDPNFANSIKVLRELEKKIKFWNSFSRKMGLGTS